MSRSAENEQIIVIEPPGRGFALGLREVWDAREVAYFLAWRDIRIRYKQTALGATWAIAQPLVLIGLFAGVLAKAADLGTGPVPYALYFQTGMVTWTIFAYALQFGSQSLVREQHILTKIYVPRLLIPLATMSVGLIDLAISVVILVFALVISGVAIPLQAVLAPLIILAGVVLAVGASLTLASLNVRYRDVQYALPFATQVLFFASPVAYDAGNVPGAVGDVLEGNPIAVIINTMRWSLLDQPAPSVIHLVIGSMLAIAIVVCGLLYFERTQRSLVDHV